MANIETDVPKICVEYEIRNQQPIIETNSSGGNQSGSDSDQGKTKNRKLKLTPRHKRKDSGSSVGEDDEISEITQEMKEKIVAQAEYYFSDENLKKDGFLLKHVKRNKEGYVNLKLLASFKKMRSLNRDYRVIGEALKESTKLEVNETGLKLRRRDPLPKELLEQVRVKHVVVSNITNENPSMNYITEAFSKHKDDVVSVRIVKPGKKFPNDLQSHFSRHPELREEVVAVVEFDNPDIAADAMKTSFLGSYEGLCVKLLELGPKQSKKIDGDTASDTPVDSDASTGGKRSNSSKKKNPSRLLEVSGAEENYSSYASSSDGEFSSFSSCSKRYNRSRGSSPVSSPKMNRRSDGNRSNNSSPMTSPAVSPKFLRKNVKKDNLAHHSGHKLSPLVNQNSPRSSPEMQRQNNKSKEENNAGQSAWMLKRMQLNGSRDSDSEILRAGANKHLDIIRQPKGPDGSIGFANHPLKKYVLIHAF